MNAHELESPERKLVMWYKVKEKREKGLSKSKISRELGIDVKTVRKYLRMSYSDFKSSESYMRKYNKLLDKYESQVHEWLDNTPELSSSQIYDWLRENYDNFPNVNIKTVYNFVKYVRKKYSIEKPKVSNTRDLSHTEETPYGEYAQADFGEMWMRYEDNRRIKVYFFVMVLCRSRKKYVFFSKTPFTTNLAVYAHEKAFEYYGGKPKIIIYDQDAVFIHRENLGDYILTSIFNAYVNQAHFTCTFCRKGDPESKGKVENVVKYVKYNFLRGRRFKSIEQLNEEGLRWLSRTANGLSHNGTKLIPDEVFKEEYQYLTPYIGTPAMPEREMRKYVVRKDNVIQYRGNFYSLPLGTYRGEKSFVWINICGNIMEIYDGETGKQIVQHTIDEDRGKFISNDASAHRRQRKSISKREALIQEYCNHDELLTIWLENLKQDKERYYYVNVLEFDKEMKHYDQATLHKALEICLDRGLYNAKDLMRLCEKIGEKHPIREHDETWKEKIQSIVNEVPNKTDIQYYNSIMS